MIHYHGGPITPLAAAHALWSRRHGMTSFAHREQMALMAEVCQSFVLDNGAFSHWRAGHGQVDVMAYAAWVREWVLHPGFDWCVIPDVIDGDEAANDYMIERWREFGIRPSVPVWHLHESLGRLARLCAEYNRIALGSSGQWSTIGTDAWWARMDEVRDVVCDELGRPRVKLHGLRMLSPEVYSQIPLASADSCNAARNVGLDNRWSGPYQPLTEATRAIVLAERIEQHAAASSWRKRAAATQLELIA